MMVPSRNNILASYSILLLFLSFYTTAMSALTRIATFRLSPKTSLAIVRGSVVDFQHARGAIVNAANEGCLGGGGVDGAISAAGGPNLQRDRAALPLLGNGVRCPTGHAKRTGPGQYGDLLVPHVIHAVGPCYHDYDSFQEADELLESAYSNSLDRAQEANLEAIAFSLLSAGVFRGKRTVKDVLSIGIRAIREWIQKQGDSASLSEVYLFGFNAHEVNTLVDICEDDLKLEMVKENSDGSDAAAEEEGEEEKKGEEDDTKEKVDDKNELQNKAGDEEEKANNKRNSDHFDL